MYCGASHSEMCCTFLKPPWPWLSHGGFRSLDYVFFHLIKFSKYDTKTWLVEETAHCSATTPPGETFYESKCLQG